MEIKKNFIEWANLVGSINFDNDACYDNCDGWIKLSNGPAADDVIIYERFIGFYDRDVLMQKAFSKAAEIMAKSAKSNQLF